MNTYRRRNYNQEKYSYTNVLQMKLNIYTNYLYVLPTYLFRKQTFFRVSGVRINHILGEFAQSRKSASYLRHVCPPGRMYQSGSHSTDFRDIW